MQYNPFSLNDLLHICVQALKDDKDESFSPSYAALFFYVW
jgi:hypothetical protein